MESSSAQTIGIYILITLIYVYCICTFSLILGSSRSFSDYRAQYTGSLMIAQGERDNFYSLDTQYIVQSRIIPGLDKSNLLPFFSPPPIAYALSPLAYFSQRQGFLIFGFTLLCMFFLISYITYHSIHVSKKVQEIFYIKQIDILIVFALFMPLWLSILNAQFSIVWLFIILISYLLAKKNKQELSGFALSFIVLKPHLVIIPLLFLIIQKQWKTILGMITGILILFIFSIYLVGWKGMDGYFKLLTNTSGNGVSNGIALMAQPTLRGILHYFLKTFLSSNVIDILWIIGGGITIYFVFQCWRRVNNTQIFDLQWALMIIVTCFTSVHTHFHDLSILFVPIVIILNYWFSVLDKKIIVHREIFRYSKIIIILILLACSEGLLYVKGFVLIFYIITIYYLQKQIKEIEKASKSLV